MTFNIAIVAILLLAAPRPALAQAVPNPGDAVTQNAEEPAGNAAGEDPGAAQPDQGMPADQGMPGSPGAEQPGGTEPGASAQEPSGQAPSGQEPGGQEAAKQGQPAKQGPAEIFPGSSERALDEADLTGLNCDQLWIARNEIFDRNGYCFQTPRGKAYFDNSNCTADSQDILSELEWGNVRLIKQAEARKGCH